jgi:protoporphyrinogen oxidase
MKPATVLVLGAGPTGLTTAYLLAKEGVRVEVLERLPWAGGLCKTFQHGGYSLDLGPHRFTPHTDDVYAFVKGLCGDDLVLVDERISFYLFGDYLRYPPKFGQLLRRVAPWDAVALGLSWLWEVGRSAVRRGADSDESYEQWMRARFGGRMVDLLFRPIVEKTWGLPLRDLSWRLARQRVAVSGLGQAAWQAVTGSRGELYRSRYYPEGKFFYPRNGFGSITDRMAQEICSHGGTIRLESQVEAIHLRDRHVAGVEYSVNGRRNTTIADAVVSTLPATLLPLMLKPVEEDSHLEQVREAAAHLRFRKLILLYLVVERVPIYQHTVAFFPSGDFIFGRTWEQGNFSREMMPDGCSVFGAEITCWDDDDIWAADDAQAFERAIPQLEATGVLRRDEVKEYFTVRLDYVYPVLDRHFERHLSSIEDYVAGVENLWINGRPGLFSYINVHQAIEMGMLAARHLLTSDKGAWRQDRDKFWEYRLIE